MTICFALAWVVLHSLVVGTAGQEAIKVIRSERLQWACRLVASSS